MYPPKAKVGSIVYATRHVYFSLLESSLWLFLWQTIDMQWYIHGDIKAALRSSLFDLSWGSVVPVFQSQLRSVLQCILDYVVLTCPLLLSGLSCLSYFVFLQKISVPCSSSNTSCKFQVMHSLPDVTSGVQMRSSSSACWMAAGPCASFFLCIFHVRSRLEEVFQLW